MTSVRRVLASLRVTPLSAGVLVVVLGTVVFSFTHLRPVTDAVVYRFGGDLVIGDPSSLYTASSPNALPFTYPPFAALLFAPLAFITDSAVTVFLSVATLAALVRVSALVWPRAMVEGGIVAGDDVGLQRRIATIAVVLAPLAFAFEPVWETLKYGQINVLLCWLVVEDLLAPATRRWRGVLVGVATGIKLTPAIFVGLLAIGRRWRDVVIAVATAAATVVVGFVAAPQASWDYWFGGVLGADRVGAAEFGGNQSLNGVVVRAVGEQRATVVWLLAAVSVAAGGAFVARMWWRRGGVVTATVTVALVGLLISPVSWSHHWVWAWVLVPVASAIVLAARRGGHGVIAGVGVVLGVGWLVATLLRAVWWLPTGDGIESGRGVGLALLSSPYVVLGILTLGWLAAAAMARDITGSGSSVAR